MGQLIESFSFPHEETRGGGRDHRWGLGPFRYCFVFGVGGYVMMVSFLRDFLLGGALQWYHVCP